MIKRFCVLLAALHLTIVSVQAAAIADLLEPSKKMTCAPQLLNESSTFTIDLPAQHGDSLIVLLPEHDYSGRRFVVYPKPRWPLKLTAETFKTLKSVTWTTRDLVGTASFPNYVFMTGGRYAVVVGSGFDTPLPVVDGWCHLDYVVPETYRHRSLPHPGPLREGHAWNRMKCSPAVLTPDSTLTIAMPFPHGPYLEISRKVDRLERFIVEPAYGGKGIDAGEFGRMRSISLKVADIEGPAGRGYGRAFVESGVYTIRLGSTFEVDPAVEGWCRVRYRAPKRRS